MVTSNRAMWAFLGVAAGAAFAVAMVWPARARGRAQIEDKSSRVVDEASEDSFPASDPPSFSADRGAQAAPGSRV
jgi:hypothetical protein